MTTGTGIAIAGIWIGVGLAASSLGGWVLLAAFFATAATVSLACDQ